MKNFAVLFVAALLLFPGLSRAQDVRNCASHDYLEMQMQQDPDRTLRMEQLERFTERFVQNYPQAGSRNVITIPTVVHVVYRTSAQNISDAQVQSQIDVLNEDFRRLNADASNTPSQYLGVAADAQIEFCLATVDPNGNPTNGITRTSTSRRSFSYTNDGVKFASSGGKDAWPTNQYLNIWVCNLSNSLLGYAQFPGGPAATDGVVVLYSAFGRGSQYNLINAFSLGRTTTHEVGHWLNLRHIWGDGPCGADDGVSDTPESDAANYGCAAGHQSCGSRDMVENYMDYSDDYCMNIFTTGQAGRMTAVFSAFQSRADLLTSPGCGGGSGGPTCTAPSALSAQNVTNTSATLTWTAANGASSYNVEYRTGNGNWTSASTSGTSLSVSGLSSCTPYEFRVQSDCGGGTTSTFSSSSNFTTTGCTGGSCGDPTNVAGSASGGRNFTVSWNAVSGANSYNIRIRSVGSSSWSNFTSTTNSISFRGSRNVTYEFQVQAVCSGSTSNWAPQTPATYTVRLMGARMAEDAWMAYPNPADELLTVEFGNLVAERVHVTLIDMLGRTVWQAQNLDPQAEGAIDVPVSTLEAGVYLLRIEDGNSFSEVEKVVISH